MNDLVIFENERFGKVMVLIEGENRFYAATDVAACMGYKAPYKAVVRSGLPTIKRMAPRPGKRCGAIQVNFFTENNAYKFVERGYVIGQEELKKWLVDEVFPMAKSYPYIAEEVPEQEDDATGWLEGLDDIIRIAEKLKEELSCLRQ